MLKNIIDAPIHVQKRKADEAIREAYDLLRKMGLEDKAEAYPLPALRAASASVLPSQGLSP